MKVVREYWSIKTQLTSWIRLPELLTPEGLQEMLVAIAHGLDDYTTDQRGDVGSWLRGASLVSLSRCIIHVAETVRSDADRSRFLPDGLLGDLLARMLKQTLDRIDSLRELAWSVVADLAAVLAKYRLGPPEMVKASCEVFDP